MITKRYNVRLAVPNQPHQSIITDECKEGFFVKASDHEELLARYSNLEQLLVDAKQFEYRYNEAKNKLDRIAEISTGVYRS